MFFLNMLDLFEFLKIPCCYKDYSNPCKQPSHQWKRRAGREKSSASICWGTLSQEDILGEIQPTSTVRSLSYCRPGGWYCGKFQKVLQSQPVMSTDRWLSNDVGHSAMARACHTVASLQALLLLLLLKSAQRLEMSCSPAALSDFQCLTLWVCRLMAYQAPHVWLWSNYFAHFFFVLFTVNTCYVHAVCKYLSPFTTIILDIL